MKIVKIQADESIIEDMVLESIGNAHYYFSAFLNSSDANRIAKNPHGIKYERMFNTFGEPSFVDSYKGSSWWVLVFNNETYTVDVHFTEGSSICKDIICDIYDKQFSIDAQTFTDELFSMI